MADVKYDFAADVTAATRAIAALEAKVEKLENANKQLHRTSKRGAQDAVSDFKRWTTGLVTVGVAYSGVQRAIGLVIEGNRTLSREIDQLINRLSEEELKLKIQGGFTPPQLEGQVGVIGQQLLKTPAVDLPQGIMLQTQLVSSGFKQIDVQSGAALKTILDLQAATNQFGKALENPKETVKAISQLLKGLGLENTAENIRMIGGDFSELFAGMDIAAKDLVALASVSATLTAAKQTPQVQLAAFAAVTELLGGPIAATTLKQLTTRSIGAADTPKGVEGLATLGIRADQIDLDGETIIDVLDLLGASIKRLTEEGRGVEAQRAIFSIFGQEAGANMLSAISVAPRAREALAIVQGQGFEQAVDIFNQSRHADNQRRRIRTQLLQRDVGQAPTFEELYAQVDELQAASAASDASPTQRALDLARLNAVRIGLGVSEGIGNRPDETNAQAILNEIRNGNHILQEIRDLQPDNPQRSTRTINRNVHTEDAPVPAGMTSTRGR